MRCAWMEAAAPLGVVAALALGCAGTPRPGPQPQIQDVAESALDKAAFADELMLLHEKEMALAALALDRSDNPAVHALAQQLGGSHAERQELLQVWALGRELELSLLDLSAPEGTGGSGIDEQALTEHAEKRWEGLSAKVATARADVSALEGLQGAEFDRAFLEQVRKDHEQGLRLLEKGQREFQGDATFVALLVRDEPVFEEQRHAAGVAERSLTE